MSECGSAGVAGAVLVRIQSSVRRHLVWNGLGLLPQLPHSRNGRSGLLAAHDATTAPGAGRISGRRRAKPAPPTTRATANPKLAKVPNSREKSRSKVDAKTKRERKATGGRPAKALARHLAEGTNGRTGTHRGICGMAVRGREGLGYSWLQGGGRCWLVQNRAAPGDAP